jgi:hypothetical protein
MLKRCRPIKIGLLKVNGNMVKRCRPIKIGFIKG